MFMQFENTSTDSVDASLVIDSQVRLNVHHTAGHVDQYGSGVADTLTGTGLGEHFDGRGGADIINAGGGDDTIVFDPADTIDGGLGIDGILLGGPSIDLTGANNPGFQNIEYLDMSDNNSADNLTVDTADMFSWVGDNSLDSLLPDSAKKLVINGDANDHLILDGNDLSNLGPIPANGLTYNPGLLTNPFGDDDNYYLFQNNGLDVYVHEDLFSPPAF